MERGNEIFSVGRVARAASILAIILAAVSLSIFLYKWTVTSGDYFAVEGSNYKFSLIAPKGWVAEEKNMDDLGKNFQDCEYDKTGLAGYEVGRARFMSYKYPANFGEGGVFVAGFPSGAILDISVNCLPANPESKIFDYSYGNLRVGGEKAFEQVLEFAGGNKAKYISLESDGMQYVINEYIYISAEDQKDPAKEAGIRKQYEKIFNGIISTIRFSK